VNTDPVCEKPVACASSFRWAGSESRYALISVSFSLSCLLFFSVVLFFSPFSIGMYVLCSCVCVLVFYFILSRFVSVCLGCLSSPLFFSPNFGFRSSPSLLFNDCHPSFSLSFSSYTLNYFLPVDISPSHPSLCLKIH